LFVFARNLEQMEGFGSDFYFLFCKMSSNLLSASPRGAPYKRRSSAVNPSLKEFESLQDPRQNSALSAFLASSRFENRNLLDGLLFDPDYLVNVRGIA
jgi:hypothetical protein